MLALVMTPMTQSTPCAYLAGDLAWRRFSPTSPRLTRRGLAVARQLLNAGVTP